jgi:hypothetical protein
LVFCPSLIGGMFGLRMVDRITQLDAWLEVSSGSSTERLMLSISRPLFSAKADAARRPERRLGLRTGARRLFDHLVRAHQYR